MQNLVFPNSYLLICKYNYILLYLRILDEVGWFVDLI